MGDVAAREAAEPAGLRILFEDGDLVVVMKPSGMPSVPARTAWDPPDVASVLLGRCGTLEAVHRLDRDTSGLLVLARSRDARARLGRAFEAGLVDKRYLAVVHGEPPLDHGEIHQPLADDPAHPPRKRVDPILGRRATTRWRTLRRLGTGGERMTLVELEPVTGRSHQLRVHLAWLGCPIVGDGLYASAVRPGDRLALHAAAIAFPHPRDDARVSLVSDPPDTAPWSLVSLPSA